VTIEVGYCESIEIGDATAGDRQAANRPTPAAAAAAAALLVHADQPSMYSPSQRRAAYFSVST